MKVNGLVLYSGSCYIGEGTNLLPLTGIRPAIPLSCLVTVLTELLRLPRPFVTCILFVIHTAKS
jgi:hypothetical protein